MNPTSQQHQPAASAAGLSFTAAGPEFHFDTGFLKGTLHPEGMSSGLIPLTHSATGTELAGMFGLLSPYRLLTPDVRFGTAAWDWPSTAAVQQDGSVRVDWRPDEEHPLEMTAVYRWRERNVADLRLTVRPHKNLHHFEVFLASYFNGFPVTSACVAANPDDGGRRGFMEAPAANGGWQAFPRDEAATALFADGRWTLEPHPLPWVIMPRLAAPLAMRRDPDTGLAALLMGRPEDCFAISMPENEDYHRSVYLSLFGRDFQAGDEATTRARLVIDAGLSAEQAMALFDAFLRDE